MEARVLLLLAMMSAGMAALSANAEVKLGLPFSDHMVLQRDKPVAVWGTAEPGECVAVAFAGQAVKTKADAKGDWRVNLKPMPASKESRVLTANSVRVEDVVVSSKDVPTPVKLRYLHSSPWTGTLFSEVNLPVGAFHIGF